MIDDAYEIDLWNEYAASRTGEWLSFRTYIVHIATLYSMNATMLGLSTYYDPLIGHLVLRLAGYHEMISDLHLLMSRYLQISSLRPFSASFKTSEERLNELSSTVGISDRMFQIRSLAYDLYTQILSVIAIYGIPPLPPVPVITPTPGFPVVPGNHVIPGTEIIFKLFENHLPIRCLIGQNVCANVRDDVWLVWALRIIRAELLTINDRVWEDLYWSGSTWVRRLVPMVNTALGVLDSPPPAGPSGSTSNPPPPGGPSGNYPPPPQGGGPCFSNDPWAPIGPSPSATWWEPWPN
jgi:hypothetical protein